VWPRKEEGTSTVAKSTTSPRATPATKGTEPVEPTEGTQEAPVQPVADEPQAHVATPAPAASAARKPFKLGPVNATAERLGLAGVLERLDEGSLERIAAMEKIASVIAQAERLLATDGRIAPVVFCDDALFYGHENLALAKLAGKAEIIAVYILPEDAGVAQSFLAKQKRPARPQPEGDEELFWQVIAHYGS
jgi:hypothetical protein